ncbi:MAG: DUF2752 domain-containing protein [Saprospiraceae bacterium]
MTPNFRRAVELGVLIVVPVVLLVLPADYFDTGESVCLSVVLLDTECYGCGITRSVMHLIHGNLTESLYYNYLGVVVTPLLAFVAGTRIWTNLRALGLLPGR